MDTQEKIDPKKQPGWNPNPTGKGGFQMNPQNRNPGGWKKEDSISYQYNLLIRLTVDEFYKWMEKNPKDQRTMAQELAYQAVQKARKEINYLREITDRIEGKPMQSTDITTQGKSIQSPLLVSTIVPRHATTQSETTEGS